MAVRPLAEDVGSPVPRPATPRGEPDLLHLLLVGLLIVLIGLVEEEGDVAAAAAATATTAALHLGLVGRDVRRAGLRGGGRRGRRSDVLRHEDRW